MDHIDAVHGLQDDEALFTHGRKDQAEEIEDHTEANAAYQANVANLVEAEKTTAMATDVWKTFST